MKKTVFLFALALGLTTFSFAQNNNKIRTNHTGFPKTEPTQNKPDKTPKTTINKKVVKKPARDFVMFGLTYDNWFKTPEDVHITGFGRGFMAHIVYDFPISESHFSFAAGVGISTHNIYFNKQIPVMNDSSQSIWFKAADTTFFKKAKLTTTYLEGDFELRFFSNKENRNRGFKMAIGAQVGLLMGTHSKWRHSGQGIPDLINEKVNTNRYVQKWRIAPIIRIGWGHFSVFGSYSLSALFKDGQGPHVFPYSIGVSISGL